MPSGPGTIDIIGGSMDFLMNIDHSIFYFFNHTLSNPVLDQVIEFFYAIPGRILIYLIPAILLFLGTKRLKFSMLTLLAAFGVTSGVYKTIKYAVQRPRPFHVLQDVNLVLGEHSGYSFPSGHSSTSFCIATVVAMRYPGLRYPAFIAASLVALSRPYVGVHYPSDILVGGILGTVIGYFVTKAAESVVDDRAD